VKDTEEIALRLAFSARDREAVYRAIHSRRDIRRQFTGEPISVSILRRILEAAHHAPSVGFMQPWNFILVRNRRVREQVQRLAEEERRVFALSLPPERAERFRDIKIEGILESSLNICVTCDSSRAGPHVLGRHAIPETDRYSTCLAIANLWLAARAEGIGVGWVSFYRTHELRSILEIPGGIEPVAYLCVGPVTEFPFVPDLEAADWEQRRTLASLVFDDRWARHSRLFEEE
jgi:5,6-dimethylbenzimidazole synthase